MTDGQAKPVTLYIFSRS